MRVNQIRILEVRSPLRKFDSGRNNGETEFAVLTWTSAEPEQIRFTSSMGYDPKLPACGDGLDRFLEAYREIREQAKANMLSFIEGWKP